MASNILVVTGSARKDGNTMTLARSFIKGARKSGNAVRRFDAANKRIEPCRDCDNCWRKGLPCIVNDDFNAISPFLHVSDIIVFASPVYWGGFSAAVKAFIDKLHAYLSEKRTKQLRISKAILLLTAAEEDDDVFNGALETYKVVCKMFNWEDLGHVLVKGVRKIGDIDTSEKLREAYELGLSIK
ncbi:MAG: flavodoxin family protein [Bacilli bacterium]|jgi:multimeric flavodoxin WrbA